MEKRCKTRLSDVLTNKLQKSDIRHYLIFFNRQMEDLFFLVGDCCGWWVNSKIKDRWINEEIKAIRRNCGVHPYEHLSQTRADVVLNVIPWRYLKMSITPRFSDRTEFLFSLGCVFPGVITCAQTEFSSM